MTDRPRSLGEALDAHDVTLALTPGQILLGVIGVLLILRLVRRLRS